MASSSSSSSSHPCTWKYNVFASFHGPDVRKSFLSHFRGQFKYHGITMFDDQKIERSATIAPALEQGIKESRISILIFSENYASSRWCLDELVEIMKCREEMGQIVIPVFYGVDPSHVRNQTGLFGIAFEKTCQEKSEEKKKQWKLALTIAGNIAGEHFLNWDDEADMVENIARDVSNKLHATVSRDFEDMVGIEAHLQKMLSLLRLDEKDGALIAGICGPAGIGKTTIARALRNRLLYCEKSFQLTCFMENVRGSYDKDVQEYASKMRLQKQFLSKILNLSDIKISHLGTIRERLCRQKVLIFLDDVDDLKQLEALADKPNWFGDGSRIIVTTEDQELLEQHDINITYHVDFPTKEEAFEMFCRYAFRQSSAPHGFEKLAERVTYLCSNLPLGLRVVGSSLRGKKEDDWEDVLHGLENSLDPVGQDIERVLRIGYDSLYERNQLLFLLIAFFFNHQDVNHVKTLLRDSNFNVRLGLKTLVNKSLIQISTSGIIVMHKLLQQVGRQANEMQKPRKRKILTDTDDIRDVLEKDSGNRNVMGICFDVSRILYDLHISPTAFKEMPNLQFFSVKGTISDQNVRVHVPEDMGLPHCLKYLHWMAYPSKSLPLTFSPEFLVEINMQGSELELLWPGTKRLTNLKKFDLSNSLNLKELPDLSSATKLELLEMNYCKNLQVVPTHFNLASLKMVGMVECSQLRKIPNFSSNITQLFISDTMLVEMPDSLWPHLTYLIIYGRIHANELCPDIEKLPDWIKDLDVLNELHISGLPKLASLPELPNSLSSLSVDNCESLETLIYFSFDSHPGELFFYSCFGLNREARRIIMQQPFLACLPGRRVPTYFNHRVKGHSLTIRSDFQDFRICALVSPKPEMEEGCSLICRVHLNDCLIDYDIVFEVNIIETNHLFICGYTMLEEDGWVEQDNDISFEFSTSSPDIEVIECGVRLWAFELDESVSSYESSEEDDDDENLSDGSYEFDEPRVKRLKI